MAKRFLALLSPGRPFSSLLWALLLLALPGCLAASGPVFTQLTAAPEKPMCRIAVLPLLNHTDFIQGGTIFYRIFMAELNQRPGFTVIQEGDIRAIYRQLRINPRSAPSHEQTLVLADRLKADALISGEIVTMRDNRGAKETKPVLAVNLTLTPAGADKPMLTTYHRRSGEDYRKIMHFGLVNTMTSLAALVADEILDLWQAHGLTPCAS